MEGGLEGDRGYRLDGWCEGGLGQQRNARQYAKDRKGWRALVHM